MLIRINDCRRCCELVDANPEFFDFDVNSCRQNGCNIDEDSPRCSDFSQEQEAFSCRIGRDFRFLGKSIELDETEQIGVTQCIRDEDNKLVVNFNLTLSSVTNADQVNENLDCSDCCSLLEGIEEGIDADVVALQDVFSTNACLVTCLLALPRVLKLIIFCAV